MKTIYVYLMAVIALQLVVAINFVITGEKMFNLFQIMILSMCLSIMWGLDKIVTNTKKK